MKGLRIPSIATAIPSIATAIPTCDRCSGVIATGIPTGLRPMFGSIATG